MKMFVLGGTRGTGRKFVEAALAHDHTVTAIARNPSAMDLTHANLRVVQGDVLDVATLIAAMPGHDVVVFAVGATLTALKANPYIFSEGTKHTLEAMQRTGVRKLVALTSHGSGDSRQSAGFFSQKIVRPLLLAPYFDDHDRQEALIRASDVEWVLVRPTMLTNGRAKGDYKIVEQPGAPGAMISRADVADFMLIAAETPKYANKAISIG